MHCRTVAFEEPTHRSGLDRVVCHVGRRRNADLSRRRKLSVQTKHAVTPSAPNTLIFVCDVRELCQQPDCRTRLECNRYLIMALQPAISLCRVPITALVR